jgi:hypothetical protein
MQIIWFDRVIIMLYPTIKKKKFLKFCKNTVNWRKLVKISESCCNGDLFLKLVCFLTFFYSLSHFIYFLTMIESIHESIRASWRAPCPARSGPEGRAGQKKNFWISTRAGQGNIAQGNRTGQGRKKCPVTLSDLYATIEKHQRKLKYF